MKKFGVNLTKALILPVAVFFIFAIIAYPRFGMGNLLVISIQAITSTTIGYGLYFFLQADMFDVSMGAQMILASFMGGMLSKQFGLVGFVIGCIGFAMLLSLINATVYRITRVPSMIVTMGLVMVYEAGSRFFGVGSGLQIEEKIGVLGRTPYNIIFMAGAAVLFYIVCTRTRFAAHVRAIGSGERLAASMGVKVANTKFLIFIISGIFVGITALLYISYSGTIAAQYSLGSIQLVFKPFIGVLVGMQLSRFINMALAIYLGQFCVSTFFSGIIAMGAPDTWQNIMLGLFLIGVMIFSENQKYFKDWFRRRKVRKAADEKSGG